MLPERSGSTYSQTPRPSAINVSSEVQADSPGRSRTPAAEDGRAIDQDNLDLHRTVFAVGRDATAHSSFGSPFKTFAYSSDADRSSATAIDPSLISGSLSSSMERVQPHSDITSTAPSGALSSQRPIAIDQAQASPSPTAQTTIPSMPRQISSNTDLNSAGEEGDAGEDGDGSDEGEGGEGDDGDDGNEGGGGNEDDEGNKDDEDDKDDEGDKGNDDDEGDDDGEGSDEDVQRDPSPRIVLKRPSPTNRKKRSKNYSAPRKRSKLSATSRTGKVNNKEPDRDEIESEDNMDLDSDEEEAGVQLPRLQVAGDKKVCFTIPTLILLLLIFSSAYHIYSDKCLFC